MFTTHMLGCFEDNETGLLHVDILKYKDASSYTHYTFIDNAIDGKDYPDGLTQVVFWRIQLGTLFNLIQLFDDIPHFKICVDFHFRWQGIQ